MPEAEQRIAALRNGVTAAQTQRARAEAQRDALNAQLSQACVELASFGVTEDTASERLQQMETELNDLLSRAEAALGRTTQ